MNVITSNLLLPTLLLTQLKVWSQKYLSVKFREYLHFKHTPVHKGENEAFLVEWLVIDGHCLPSLRDKLADLWAVLIYTDMMFS